MAASRFVNFRNQDALMQFARDEVRRALGELYTHVILCWIPILYRERLSIQDLPEPPQDGLPREFLLSALNIPLEFPNYIARQLGVAKLPSVLTSFGTIELFSGFHAGRIGEKRGVDYGAVETYVERFMHYDPKLIRPLFGLYRHKIAHLGRLQNYVPLEKSIDIRQDGQRRRIKKGQKFSWVILFGNPQRHLKLEQDQVRRRTNKHFRSERSALSKYKLALDVGRLASDTINSVLDPVSGYFQHLNNDVDNAQEKFDKAVTGLYFP